MKNGQNATRLIWDLAESLYAKDKKVRRTDVIQACLKRGISYATVVTQISAWVTARRVFTDRGFKPGLVGAVEASKTAAKKRKPSKKAAKPAQDAA